MHLDRAYRTIKRSAGEPQAWQHFYRDDPVDAMITADTAAKQSR